MTVNRTRAAISFDPPITAETLPRLPVKDKRVVVGFVRQVLGREPTREEILDFLQTLGLLEEGKDGKEEKN